MQEEYPYIDFSRVSEGPDPHTSVLAGGNVHRCRV
jgi:hypothetical protein